MIVRACSSGENETETTHMACRKCKDKRNVEVRAQRKDLRRILNSTADLFVYVMFCCSGVRTKDVFWCARTSKPREITLHVFAHSKFICSRAARTN
ncbi:hypothetical protein BaRGS_00011264 [Batillaria attramentaria]|uniref:Uncharacterized protein n=1 Tax=Batillaria attramentaria TaxID=370345 RepID=A0ABD0LDN3_9CAEN